MIEKNKSNEISLTRLYDAPVKTVWDAFTEPEQAAQWWGPRGFILTTHSKDLRAGGGWSYTMHGPDGKNYPNKTKYHVVEKYSRLVYDHGATDDTPPLFRVTVQFSEVNGKTKMDMTMALETAEAAARTREFIRKAGGNATWDRFAEYLAKKATNEEVFVINRSFEAPIETIFELWTEPKHFIQWLPPTGFTMRFIEADIREGGNGFYAMSNDAGVTMYGKLNYLKIQRPERIVYTQYFCDEKGKVSRHPFAPTWPETMRTTVLLSSEGPQQTRVTVLWQIEGQATQEEIRTFTQSKGGMTQGWTGSFDKLETYLITHQPKPATA